MIRLPFNPFKLQTVPHYTYEYLDLHGNVVRGPYSFTEPLRAAARGLHEATLRGRYPLSMRVIDQKGNAVVPPEFSERNVSVDATRGMAVWQRHTIEFTPEALKASLKEAQTAHHKHEQDVLHNYQLGTARFNEVAKELAATWVDWYVDYIFTRRDADAAIDEITQDEAKNYGGEAPSLKNRGLGEGRLTDDDEITQTI